jgi:SAM-dependent methyltransferase
MGNMVAIARHRTAMTRHFVSRPVQQALADGLLEPEHTFFDYGCGRGGDIRHLRQLGYDATGWDPAHASNTPKREATVVNLGYVVNVIEDPAERTEVLRKAWQLAVEVLIVSARLDWEAQAVEGREYGDGVLTRTGTFQKFFRQDELRSWIDSTLHERSVAAAPGVFYVFRSAVAAQRLLARHARGDSRPRLGIAELIYQQNAVQLQPLADWIRANRRLPETTDLPDSDTLVENFGSIRAAFSLIRRVDRDPAWADIDLGSRRRSEERFASNLEILQPIIDFLADRGRLPRDGELDSSDAIASEFGSVRAAFSLIRRVTGDDRWKDYAARARQDFLVYLALTAFGGRPKFAELPDDLQYDVRDLFGSYKEACADADRLLFAVGKAEAVDLACRASTVGKLTPEALYTHVDAAGRLPAVLRVYVGCGEALTGKIDEATILKLHRQKAQVSFLVYPSFDRDPHPALAASIVSRLGQLRVSYKDFSDRENPPVLHRKETFVPDDYRGRAKFAKLTDQEERAGLLNSATIGTLAGWNEALNAAGFRLRGHRLVRDG